MPDSVPRARAATAAADRADDHNADQYADHRRPEQLALDVQLQDRTYFDTFEPGDNAEAVRAVSAGGNVLLVGATGSGKSHLLQAACRAGSAAYFPLRELASAGPELLEGLDGLATLAVDDLAVIAGHSGWEQAVMRVIDSRRQSGARWLMSVSAQPADVGFAHPDLVSRLQSSTIYSLKPLDDTQRLALLKRRCGHRGLVLDQNAASYLLKHIPRDTTTLVGWVDRLDKASLSAGKRLTIPLIRDVLSQDTQ